MGQVPHGCAATTEAIRRAIQHSQESLRSLSRRYGINPKTVAKWKKRGFEFAGATESFRGYDGIRTIAAAIEKAGVAEPKAIQKAFWDVKLTGLNGPIAFTKSGPEGKESGQSKPLVYLIKIEGGKVVLVNL